MSGVEVPDPLPGVAREDQRVTLSVEAVVVEVAVVAHVAGMVARGQIQRRDALERRPADRGAVVVDQLHHALLERPVDRQHLDRGAAGWLCPNRRGTRRARQRLAHERHHQRPGADGGYCCQESPHIATA